MWTKTFIIVAMTTIIILITLLIFAILIVPFTRQIVKDKVELRQTPINEKFKVLVSVINEVMLDGKGEITLFDDDPRLMNLMSDERRNMLIQFYYSTGNLTIILNYKYFQKELIHKELYSNVRNISVYQQKNIANSFIEVCNKKILEHQQKVTGEDADAISSQNIRTSSESDPTQLLSGVYEDFSPRQKKSVLNLLYIIGKNGGFNDAEILKTSAISQMALILNVRKEESLSQYNNDGENAIYNDLKDIEEGCMVSIILSALQLVHELSLPNQDVTPNLEASFFDAFYKVGYSEERIEGILQKMALMQKYFGL